MKRVLLLAAAALVAVLGAIVLWAEASSAGWRSDGPQVTVEVPKGASVTQVGAILAGAHVIRGGTPLRIWLLVHGSPLVEPGAYALRVGMGDSAAFSLMAKGPNVHAVDVLPGYTVAEVARQVGEVPGYDEATFARVASSGAVRSAYEPAGSSSLEGLLGSGLYTITPPARGAAPGALATALLQRMVARFDTEAGQAGVDQAAATLGLTPYDVVTAASIVQKEGATQVSTDISRANMDKVARVIYNRLAAGMPLQMDSTVLYAEGRDGGTVTSTDLAMRTPYNTYLNHGLTPTPIGVSSADALSAATHPAAGSWLYFVLVQKDGTEAFSVTLQEQLANEQLARSRGLG